MPLAGAQRTDQIAQTVVFAAIADHPGHGRRTATRALAEAVTGFELQVGRAQQPMAPGRLQGGAEKWHQFGGQH
ncbi:hypothetical protein D3C87_1973070 [compost metagenome]